MDVKCASQHSQDALDMEAKHIWCKSTLAKGKKTRTRSRLVRAVERSVQFCKTTAHKPVSLSLTASSASTSSCAWAKSMSASNCSRLTR